MSRWTRIVLVAALTALAADARNLATGALDLAAQETPPPEIVVAGVGTVSYFPDRATVMVEVRTEAATPPAAATDNAERMERVLAALRRQGHASDRITTTGYAVQPLMRYEAGTQSVAGYMAVNAVTVRLDDVGRVGATLDTALAAGATRVRGVRFESTDREQLRRQALERAVAAARQDAEALARAAGGALGALVQLSTEPAARPVEYASTTFAAASRAPMPGGPETPVSAGELELSVQVQARWRFVGR